MEKHKTLLVAIDPFAESADHLLKLGGAADAICPPEHWSVLLASVVTPGHLGLPEEFNVGSLPEKLKDLAAKKILSQVKACQLNRFTTAEILFKESKYIYKICQAFLSHAKSKSADLIMLHTHSRSSFRSLLGSFTNAILDMSSVPTVVIPTIPVEASKKIERILFPTDFSALSHEAFQYGLGHASELKAEITLCHRLPTVIDDLLEIGIQTARGEPVIANEILLLDEDEKRNRAQEWKVEAAQREVKLSFVFGRGHSTLGNSILDEAEKNIANLIVIPKRTASLDIPSFGSTVKHVVRHSICPVVVVPGPI
jgi:nucleotide-binding universal stress UspA family protein